jgi:hypothetical protein
MKNTTTAALLLAIDAAVSLPRSMRNNALAAVHTQMLNAKLPKGHHLWERLDDAYATF